MGGVNNRLHLFKIRQTGKLGYLRSITNFLGHHYLFFHIFKQKYVKKHYF